MTFASAILLCLIIAGLLVAAVGACIAGDDE